jgi:hypothetical protein
MRALMSQRGSWMRDQRVAALGMTGAGRPFVRLIFLWRCPLESETVGSGVTAVVVLGPPGRVLVEALWRSGLRPVAGQTGGSLWARPQAREGR